jgi:hypothetical protein
MKDLRPGHAFRANTMRITLLVMAVVAVYILHQDVWFWRTSQPLAFGFLPVGLWYHALYTVGVSLLMGLLVRYAWPDHLEQNLTDETGGSRPKDGQPH